MHAVFQVRIRNTYLWPGQSFFGNGLSACSLSVFWTVFVVVIFLWSDTFYSFIESGIHYSAMFYIPFSNSPFSICKHFCLQKDR